MKAGLCLPCYGKRWRDTHPEQQATYRERHRKLKPRRCKACNEPVPYPQQTCDAECERVVVMRRRWRHRLAQYGLTEATFALMLTLQGNACALCRTPIEAATLHIDHDHETRKVRGLLCGACNTGLGKLGDTVEGLRRAIAYLEGSIL